jgi:hypothetical protein
MRIVVLGAGGQLGREAMRISGHKTRSIFDRYDITDERDIQLAGQKLAHYLEERASMPRRKSSDAFHFNVLWTSLGRPGQTL